MPYGQGSYAGIIYAGIGAAPLPVKVSPAFGLVVTYPPAMMAGPSVTANALALGISPGAHNQAGAVVLSLQAALGLCTPPGASVSVGTVIPHLQAAWGLVVGPGGLLSPSTGASQIIGPFFGLVISVAPQFGVRFLAGPALGLVVPVTPILQVEVVLVTSYRNLVSWAIGLSRPGRLVYYPDEPPVPPLTPDEEFPAWGFDDGSWGTTPEGEPIDLSYNDPALVGVTAQSDYADYSYTDASMVALAKGETVEVGYSDTGPGVAPQAKPGMDLSFSDVGPGQEPEAEPLDLSFSDAHP